MSGQREIDESLAMMRRISKAAEKGVGVRLTAHEAGILEAYFAAFVLHNACDACIDRGRETTCKHPLPSAPSTEVGE